MIELLEANWLILVIALVIGLLVAWWLFVANRRTKVEIEPVEAEAEAKGPRRNQALIDAPPAAAGVGPMVPTLAREQEAEATTVPPAVPSGSAGTEMAFEPTAASAPPPAPAPAPAPAPEPEEALSAPTSSPPTAPAVQPAPSETPDDLTRIKGLGPKLVTELHALGVTSLAQIARWDEAEIDRIDAQLGRFQGRIRRDQWPEQARLLAAGDEAAYEARFGKL